MMVIQSAVRGLREVHGPNSYLEGGGLFLEIVLEGLLANLPTRAGLDDADASLANGHVAANHVEGFVD